MSEHQVPIRLERRDGGLYMHLHGEIDMSVVDGMGELIDAQLHPACPVAMDLLHVTFADSSLIRLIGQIDRAIRPSGHRIQVHGVSDQVRRLLELTKLDTVVDLRPE